MVVLRYGLLLVGALLIGCRVQAFTTPLVRTPKTTRTTWGRTSAVLVPTTRHVTHYTLLQMTAARNEKDKSPGFFRRLRRLVPTRGGLVRRVKPISFAVLTLLSLDRMKTSDESLLHQNFFRTKAAYASAPLPAMPQIEAADLEGEALKAREQELMAQYQKETRDFQAKAKQIEAKKGEAARQQFELEYQEEKQKQAAAKSAEVEQLKRSLLDQGISPKYDMEGERQVILFEKNVDLAEVAGTRFYAEKENQLRYPQKSEKEQKRAHRFIIASKVDDMKRRGLDPLKHFESTREDARILDMPSRKAAALELQYKENLAKYGQITVPVEGEKIMSREELAAKEAQDAKGTDAKTRAKEEKAARKAKAAAAMAKAKEEKAAAKLKQKEEKAKAKDEARAAKAAAAAAAAAASGAAAAAGAAAKGAGDVVSAGVDAVSSGTPSEVQQRKAPVAESESLADAEGTTAQSEASEPKAVEKVSKKKSGGVVPIVRVATFVAAAGGGGYAFKVYREKAEADEEERQRQFKLLMGEDGDASDGPSWSAPALEVDTDLTELASQDIEKDDSPAVEDPLSAEEPEAPVAEQPKKRKLGIKSMFSKKSGRETELSNLLAPSATAPEFAALLAKLLTFGAPGRFPDVISLPGGMPMQEFDINATKDMLLDSSASLTKESAAEVFANVANCMLIDIVDLASSALKEKDDKITVDAINVVIDFMNHAASIYDSFLDVVIEGVRYGGKLGKGKLEQMYRKYSENPGVDQKNLELLQYVFSISDKKAEGIMLKSMTKNLMQMMKGMKDGEVPPEMQEMMESMGGLGGMEGLLGNGMDGMDGAEMSPEQYKEMVKAVLTMKESGMIEKAELDKVRQELEPVLAEAKLKAEGEEISAEEKELLELFDKIFAD